MLFQIAFSQWYNPDACQFFRLSENLRANDARSAELESEISELRRHVQQYVKEVKRVEELLNKKETERTELLEQYRQLSIEVDSAEAFGRRMEAQARSFITQ